MVVVNGAGGCKSRFVHFLVGSQNAEPIPYLIPIHCRTRFRNITGGRRLEKVAEVDVLENLTEPYRAFDIQWLELVCHVVYHRPACLFFC